LQARLLTGRCCSRRGCSSVLRRRGMEWRLAGSGAWRPSRRGDTPRPPRRRRKKKTPPRQTRRRLSRQQLLRRRELVVDDVLELLERLRAHQHAAVDEEGRSAGHAERLALVVLRVHLVLRFLAVE